MTDIRQSIAARYCSRGGIRYIGLGFYWAWLFIAFYTSVLLPTSSSASESMSGIWNWAAWAHAVTLIACALLARRLQPYALRRCSIALASVGTCVGTLLIPLGSVLEPISSAAMACAASGALITGATTAWLVLSWGVLYSRRGARFSLFGIIASYLLGIVLYFLVQLMSESIAIATTALLPACSGMLLRAASAIAPATTGHEAESEAGSPSASNPDCAKAPFAPRVILPLAAVLLYALCGEVLRGFATAPGGRATLDGMGSLYLLGSAAGLVVMGGIIALIPSFTHRRPSEMPGIRATLLIMAAGFLATTLTSASFFFAYAVFGAALQCFRALVWMYSADVTERTGAMAFSVFGATQGCAALAVVLGVPIAESLSQAVSLGAAQWSTIASIGLFLIFSSAVIVISPKSLETVWGLMPKEAAPDGPRRDPRSQPAPNGEGSDCSFLLSTYGLTARECEVALLLAKGRSLPFIQEELHIAQGTAQTHLSHIYRKLGVHSRQEFLDVIEAHRNTSS